MNKSRNANSDFMNFIVEPPIPRKRPDLTTFIHRPLQHFREILKLIQITASHSRVDSEEFKNFTSVINDLQVICDCDPDNAFKINIFIFIVLVVCYLKKTYSN